MKLPTKPARTLKDAIIQLFEAMDEKDKKFARENEHAVIHHGIGTQIRNSLNLWDPKTPIVQDVVAKYKIFGHGDDVSGLLMTGIWAMVNGQDVDAALRATAEGYCKHWRSCGIDPETGQRI